jgi:ligand-binding sensor domain-containing protein/signal transduction histidine kinase
MKRVAAYLLLAGALSVSAHAERLAIEAYTTADGLGSSYIETIVSDARGFVWLATRDGLSRFDGSEFRTYTTDDGLPHPVVNHVLVTADGEYWIATNGGGVCRFNVTPELHRRSRYATRDAARELFTCRLLEGDALSNRVNFLFEDRERRIWVATDNGIFQLLGRGSDWRLSRVPFDAVPVPLIGVRRIHQDTRGRLWIGFAGGLLAVEQNERARFYEVRGQRLDVTSIAEHDGRLWFGSRFGLAALGPWKPPASAMERSILNLDRPCSLDGVSTPEPSTGAEVCVIDERHGLPHRALHSLQRTASGRLWIGTGAGLAYVEGNVVHGLATTERLAAPAVTALAADENGQLWIGTTAGALRLSPNGLLSFGIEDGLGHPRVHAILEDPRGAILIVSGDWVLNRYESGRFRAVRARIPAGLEGGHLSPHAFLDRTGAWWLLSTRGLLRLKPSATIEKSYVQSAERMFTTRDGLPADNVVRLFEDSRGDLWIATGSPARTNLSRRRHGSGEILPIDVGLPGDVPRSFTEDRSGAVWIGMEHGGLARHKDGRITLLTLADGALPTLIDLHIDGSGRLWAASGSRGVAVLDDLSAEQPRFRYYTTAQGLSTNVVRCLTEDRQGRIYFGTARGVDRLDPATGRVTQLTTKDGLASDFVTAAYRDREGALWFGTTDGVSRLVPSPDSKAAAPRVWISELRIAGALHRTSEVGEREISGLELGPGEAHLQIAFVGFGTGGAPRYRYRLEGSEDFWTGPTDRRVVNYASLSPGRYRFVVEALSADGSASSEPATVGFEVLAPLWRRGWFIGLLLALGAAVLYSAYRYHLARVLELDRIRMRIASDLHDDIGANLSQIAILSEVAAQRLGGDGSPLRDPLSVIAASSRESLDAMSDIVWAVNPGRDSLQELSHRMRRFASDVLSASDIRLVFSSPEGRYLVVDAHVRREVLLIFKEGINNVARHSGCREAEVAIAEEGGLLTVRIDDDGRGFDREGDRGLGLSSMRRRAEGLGGELDVSSSPGRGTRLILRVPLEGPRRRWPRFHLPAWVATFRISKG